MKKLWVGTTRPTPLKTWLRAGHRCTKDKNIKYWHYYGCLDPTSKLGQSGPGSGYIYRHNLTEQWWFNNWIDAPICLQTKSLRKAKILALLFL